MKLDFAHREPQSALWMHKGLFQRGEINECGKDGRLLSGIPSKSTRKSIGLEQLLIPSIEFVMNAGKGINNP